MNDDHILRPIYDPRLPWWVCAMGAIGCCACVLVFFWSLKLLVLG